MPKTKSRVIYDKKIGLRVKEARDEIGLTRKQLGEEVFISESMVYQIERGERGLQKYVAEHLSNETGWLLDYFLGYTDFKTKEEFISDTISKIDYYRTWADSFLKMIAEQQNYSVVFENEEVIFTDEIKRSFKVPKAEINTFANEIRDFGTYILERIIQAHKHEFYEHNATAEVEEE